MRQHCVVLKEIITQQGHQEGHSDLGSCSALLPRIWRKTLSLTSAVCEPSSLQIWLFTAVGQQLLGYFRFFQVPFVMR